MENYKPNSFKSREGIDKPSEATPEIKKVVSNNVTTKKKSGFKKLTNSFIAEDLTKVKNYIFVDVLVPSIKKAISDIVKNGIDMLVYGDSNRNKNSNIPGSKVSYRSYYSNPLTSNNVARPQTSLSNYDFDDPWFEARGDAELVLSQMEDIIERYGLVKVSDLYELTGLSIKNYCANNYGWTDLRSAQVVRDGVGYIIKLPKAMPID